MLILKLGYNEERRYDLSLNPPLNGTPMQRENRETMARYSVEMFGLSKEITDLRNVEIELGEGSSLRDLVAALRRKIPALEGKVIRAGQDRLTNQYVFNIDGRFYFDTDKVQLREGSNIRLLLLSTGG